MSRNTTLLIVTFACVSLALVAWLGVSLARRRIANARPTPPPLVFPTFAPQTQPAASTPARETSIASTSAVSGSGKIVYVCQMFRVTTYDQICIMDSDGRNQRRLTTNDNARHYYPSLTPDGESVLFSSNLNGTNFTLYELNLTTGQLIHLGQPGIAPEASPNGRLIAFAQSDGKKDMIWVMNRDGSNPRMLYPNGWDPTWSPDGQKILFASQTNGLPQLFSINLDGSGLQQISDLPLLRGRSDWSADGRYIVTYSGRSWERELFLLPFDGSPVRQLTPPGGNSQGPAFSPDGQWVVFTAYFDRFGNVHGCEIYKIRIDGTGLTRLTNNDYCDWQPRWGP
ncbi:MAG: hypothetical protein N2117_04645 [Anaerolineales bacterium]|nr:hypothetical protein [Anaerolineales bacterium]MCX7754517.1 hypothetical protein [Anaerolineales bacterium]MDW8277218.1 hypothetical protein [Anaerolineales bacterium]